MRCRVVSGAVEVQINGLFSRTTWVSRYQKGETSLNLNEVRYDGVWGWQWHQLDHMQTICTSLQTDNHTNVRHSIFAGGMLFVTLNQEHQDNEGTRYIAQTYISCYIAKINLCRRKQS